MHGHRVGWGQESIMPAPAWPSRCGVSDRAGASSLVRYILLGPAALAHIFMPTTLSRNLPFNAGPGTIDGIGPYKLCGCAGPCMVHPKAPWSLQL